MKACLGGDLVLLGGCGPASGGILGWKCQPWSLTCTERVVCVSDMLWLDSKQCLSSGPSLEPVLYWGKRLIVGFFFSFQLYYSSKTKALHLYGLNPRAAAWLCVAAVVMKPNVKDQQREAVG